ncbi:L-aspartate oxidase [Gordonia sp. HY002]|uniref:L-aspartate oxidase n=1 Tax=Gordonia zhenghanii TaxID=2911516 RepID=UPI001EF0114C|nr:L-aspartate oxidase [Gordonia zhenghanii]MCF8572218.1 L-aspartate oxidase [Gordonia zhenghanii]MCF8606129.1 L-aspartate oxidase [Gordonia zhenghanii]
MTRTQQRADLVVIGAGIAGLTAALSAAERGLDVVVLNKGSRWDGVQRTVGQGDQAQGNQAQGNQAQGEHSTSTFYAQGGIAVVDPAVPEDSIELHVADTLGAGAGLTDRVATEPILADGWPAVTQLVRRGADFDSVDGRFLRTREGGHSVRRIIHAGGDATGARVQAALGAAVGGSPVTVLDDSWASDVLTSDGTVSGVAYVHGGVRSVLWAPTVLIATGGVGHVYAATTNPSGATGDGIALALRAGAHVADLEFVQFHPTMLFVPGARGRRTLVSEAVRGEGGRLVDVDGRSVTDGVHRLGDLAPRDVVARAVRAAMARTGADSVYLDITGVDDFEERFPTVTAGVGASGMDIDGGLLPVVPGAHYLCGGVVTDVDGRTNVTGLLAAGETARTGLHGANRLASNSLLEGLVMGRRAAEQAVERAGLPVREVDVPGVRVAPVLDRASLQDAMSDKVALDRDAHGLAEVAALLRGAAERRLDDLAAAEDAALLLTAKAIAAAAQAREESRGCHARTDFPDRSAVGVSRGFAFVDDQLVPVAEVETPQAVGVSAGL